ncbi:MAG: lamin tail domain-containing protein [Candidatus Moraniibacteriota bacterium]
MNGRTATFIPTLLILSFLVSSFPSFADTADPSASDMPAADSTTDGSATDTETAPPEKPATPTAEATEAPTAIDEPPVPQASPEPAPVNDITKPEPPVNPLPESPTETFPTEMDRSPDTPFGTSASEPSGSSSPVGEATATDTLLSPALPEAPDTTPLFGSPTSAGIGLLRGAIGPIDSALPITIGATPMMLAEGSVDAPTIIISEVQIEGTDAGGKIIGADEFIELYNPGNDAASLAGLKLCRKTSGTTTSQIKSFSESDTVPGKGFYLFANSDGKFATKADATTKSSPLAKDNGIALTDSCSSPTRIVDSLAWGLGKPFDTNTPKLENPPADKSFVRGLEMLKWSLSDCPTPTNSHGETITPIDACSEPVPLPPIGTIVINEFLPYPNVGEEEWIELRNIGDTEVPIAGWRLKDASSGAGYTFPTGTTISADGFLVLGAEISHIALNNTGNESVTLLFPNNTVADTYSYEGTEQGTAYARTDTETFFLTHTPTPGTVNSFDPEEKPIPLPKVGTIVINEFLPYPNVGEEEWIELRNIGDAEVPIAGWKLKDASVSGGYTFPAATTIGPDGYFVIGAEVSKIALNNTGAESITLLFPDGSVADMYSYEGTEQGTAYARTDTETFFLTHTPTPGTVNSFDPEEKPVWIPPVGTVIINELFPNPVQKGEGNEWIELRNTGNVPVSLIGWMLQSGSGKFTWTADLSAVQSGISAGGFLVIERALSKLALRNTDGAVRLFAPDGKATMDTVTYDKTIEEASYGLFEPGRFRWSETLTPGSENIFGTEPKVKKSSIPKSGYVNMLTSFSADGNKEDMKYVWDFGDGHKSYLDKTSHRYTKTGTYHGTLTASDGIEEAIKTFTIRIGKYPKRDLHLTELSTNPTGTDTGVEWIKIRNDDTKRIDLSGWIVATGSDTGKLVNHVILSKRFIAPGEEIVLTHDDAKFTLPNRQAAIELRRPDGKTVQSVSYRMDKDIEDDAVYTDTGNGWTWILPTSDSETVPAGISAANTTEPDEYETGITTNPDSDKLSFGEFVSLGTPYDPALPESLPRVLGASDERLRSGTSSSTDQSFFDPLFRLLNSTLLGTSAETT